MQFLGGRWRLRMGNFITLFLIVTCAVLVAWLSVRHPLEADLTESGRHTLSDASQAVLAGLDGEVSIIAYARQDKPLRQAIHTLVERYRRYKPEIVLQFVNPDHRPDEVRRQGIGRHGELQIRHHDRIEHAASAHESEITNALERLRRGNHHWLAFLEGHGERSPFGMANHDLGIWAKRLNARGFNIQPLDLAHLQAIPGNTHVLVLATPSTDLLPGEAALIGDYVRDGGNLLWFADPGRPRGLKPLAKQLGITFPAGVMIDSASHLVGSDDPTVVLLTASLYPPHEITHGFSITTLFPETAAIEVDDGTATWRHGKLLESASHTWLETTAFAGEIEYDATGDRIGPLTIGVTMERTVNDGDSDRTQRIVVVGDGDFLSNTYLDNGGNLELGLRIVNWLSHADDLIDIPAKTVRDAHLELSMAARFVIGLGFTLILPVVFLGVGILLWWRGRG